MVKHLRAGDVWSSCWAAEEAGGAGEEGCRAGPPRERDAVAQRFRRSEPELRLHEHVVYFMSLSFIFLGGGPQMILKKRVIKFEDVLTSSFALIWRVTLVLFLPSLTCTEQTKQETRTLLKVPLWDVYCKLHARVHQTAPQSRLVFFKFKLFMSERSRKEKQLAPAPGEVPRGSVFLPRYHRGYPCGVSEDGENHVLPLDVWVTSVHEAVGGGGVN